MCCLSVFWSAARVLRDSQRKGCPMKENPHFVIRELRRAELAGAARLVGRGMRDNPANVRIFGIPEPERRARALERFFVPVLSGVFQRGLILGAFYQDLLQGVCGM